MREALASLSSQTLLVGAGFPAAGPPERARRKGEPEKGTAPGSGGRVGFFAVRLDQESALTLEACFPLGPSVTSNSTACPSCRDL